VLQRASFNWFQSICFQYKGDELQHIDRVPFRHNLIKEQNLRLCETSYNLGSRNLLCYQHQDQASPNFHTSHHRQDFPPLEAPSFHPLRALAWLVSFVLA
jgi:hypothetical protein